MNEGWIKLHRKILDHWLYTEYRPLTRREAWENILLWANYEDDSSLIKGQLIQCKRGQLIFSLETYANKFVWSISQVRTFFDLLKKDGMIKIEGLKYTTRLTICNYDEYQEKLQTESKLVADSLHTDCTLITDSSQQEKKTKKTKNKRSKEVVEFTPPTLDDVKGYFLLNGYKEETAIKMFNSYSVANWIDSKGNKVINWKQKAINVWFKDENKQPIKQTSLLSTFNA